MIKINWNQFRDTIERVYQSDAEAIIIYPYGNIGHQIEKHIKDIGLLEKKELIKLDSYNFDSISVFDPKEYVDNSLNAFFIIATIRTDVEAIIVKYLCEKGIRKNRIIPVHYDFPLFTDKRDNRLTRLDAQEIANYRHTINGYSIDNCWQIVSDSIEQDYVVVSLTSFPARIDYVEDTIMSLLKQNYIPNKIVLWLAYDELSTDDLPESLVKLENDIFEICWCENLKSYKKLVPSLLRFKDAIIVTADDDIIYPNDWLDKLIHEHKQHPNDIICHRVTKIVKDERNCWATIPGGNEYYSGASCLNKLCGGGGTLYPIGTLGKIATDSCLFSRIAPTNDDQWFWFVVVHNGYEIRSFGEHMIGICENKRIEESPRLTEINDNGEQLFWNDFYNLLAVFPDVEKKLEDEFEKRKEEALLWRI